MIRYVWEKHVAELINQHDKGGFWEMYNLPVCKGGAVGDYRALLMGNIV